MSFFESFTGSNANPIGGNWTTWPGGYLAPQRLNNTLQSTTTAAGHATRFNGAAPKNDQFCEVVVGAIAGGEGGPMVRMASDGTSTYMFILNPTNLQLYKMVASAFSLLTSVAFTPNDGDLARIEAIGTSILCYVNGTLRLQATNAEVTSGSFGVKLQGGTSMLTLASIHAGDVFVLEPPSRRYQATMMGY